MVLPLRQAGELLFCACLDGPAPGFEERDQILLYHLGEGLSVQVHFAKVVLWYVFHMMISSKDFLKGIPAKLFLQLSKESDENMQVKFKSIHSFPPSPYSLYIWQPVLNLLGLWWKPKSNTGVLNLLCPKANQITTAKHSTHQKTTITFFIFKFG